MGAAATETVRQTLLADVGRINARAAALNVLSQRFKCDAEVAKLKLADLKRSDAVADLFERVMPAEYKTALTRSDGSRFEAANDFVSQLGFPIIDFHTCDVFALDIDPYVSIPIVGQGWHFCEQYGFDDLKLVFQLGLQLQVHSGDHLIDIFGDPDLMDDEDQNARQEVIGFWWKTFARKNRIPEELRPKGDVTIAVLETVFASRRDPLRFLPTVSRFITYSTGSIFMDFDPGHDEQDYIPELPWSKNNIVSLRREYALAQTIWDNINKLDGWLKQDRTNRITQALRLYAKARKQSDEKQQRRPRNAARIRVF